MKYFTLLVLVLLSIVCSASGFAQDSLIKISVVGHGRYSHVIYTSNGQLLSRNDIRDRLLLYDASAEEYAQYKTSKTMVFVWGGLAVSSLIIGGIEAGEHHSGPRQTFFGLAAGFLFMELFTAIHVNIYWNRSIANYNRRFVRTY